MINLLQSLEWPIRPYSTQYVSIPTLKLVEPVKLVRVIGQIIWRILHCVIWENGLVGIFLPINMAATL